MPQRLTAQAAPTQQRRTQHKPRPLTTQPAQLRLMKQHQVLLVLLLQMAAGS
jgi:hypothetical protein